MLLKNFISLHRVLFCAVRTIWGSSKAVYGLLLYFVALMLTTVLNAEFALVFDPTLVRGMSYYTGTIFEIAIPEFGGSCGGGGRYDDMIGNFTGQKVPACGFSIGFERIITILKDKLETVTPVSEKNLAILIGKNVPLDRKLEIFKRAKALRAEGTTVTIQPMRKNMKQQIEKLEAEGFKEFEKVYND